MRTLTTSALALSVGREVKTDESFRRARDGMFVECHGVCCLIMGAQGWQTRQLLKLKTPRFR
jgi:hypothetical protein